MENELYFSNNNKIREIQLGIFIRNILDLKY